MRMVVSAQSQWTRLHLSQRTDAGQRHLRRAADSHAVSRLWVSDRTERLAKPNAPTSTWTRVTFWPTAPPSGPCSLQCLNGGSCFLNARKQPKCRCQPNYRGDRCEIDQCKDYCRNGGICTPSPTGNVKITLSYSTSRSPFLPLGSCSDSKSTELVSLLFIFSRIE